MTKPELESALEDRCVTKIETLGGLCLKLRPPTGRGFPDRTVCLRGRVFFLELKRPKLGVIAAQQQTWRRLLTLAGFGVYFCDSDEKFEAALRKEMNPNGDFGSGPGGQWLPEDDKPPNAHSIPYSQPGGRGRGWSK